MKWDIKHASSATEYPSLHGAKAHGPPVLPSNAEVPTLIFLPSVPFLPGVMGAPCLVYWLIVGNHWPAHSFSVASLGNPHEGRSKNSSDGGFNNNDDT